MIHTRPTPFKPYAVTLDHEDALDAIAEQEHAARTARQVRHHELRRTHDPSLPVLPASYYEQPRRSHLRVVQNDDERRAAEKIQATAILALWRAVLSVALHDAFCPNATPADRRWLKSQSFQDLCFLAGVDAAYVARMIAQRKERWGANVVISMGVKQGGKHYKPRRPRRPRNDPQATAPAPAERGQAQAPCAFT